MEKEIKKLLDNECLDVAGGEEEKEGFVCICPKCGCTMKTIGAKAERCPNGCKNWFFSVKPKVVKTFPYRNSGRAKPGGDSLDDVRT